MLAFFFQKNVDPIGFSYVKGRGAIGLVIMFLHLTKSNRKAMNRNWSNQKANPALKTKAGNK